jgi:hypothetical protein
VFSSRGIERATHRSVAFRFIAGNEHPDHDTIATFRKRFLPQISWRAPLDLPRYAITEDLHRDSHVLTDGVNRKPRLVLMADRLGERIAVCWVSESSNAGIATLALIRHVGLVDAPSIAIHNVVARAKQLLISRPSA